MSFYLIYLYIPLLLFFFRPLKDNKFLWLYWAFVTIFSYDNVTDFFYFTQEFELYQSGSNEVFTDRGREILWVLFCKLWIFTDFGSVIIHLLSVALLVYCFFKFSRQQDVLNTAILFYFLFNLTWKFDNTLRQDVAIVLSMYVFFDILKEEPWSKKKTCKAIILTVTAILFHYSAFLLFPLYYLIKLLSQKRLAFLPVLIIVISFITICRLEMIEDMLRSLSFLYLYIGGDYGAYYFDKLSNIETGAGGFIGVVLSFVSCIPLFYYTRYRRDAYENNIVLRTCVNCTWIAATWRYNLTSDLMTRPADYLLFFQVWGFAYMFKDVLSSIRVSLNFKEIAITAICVFSLSYHMNNFISNYYGDNNYMTIFTDDCYNHRIYDRYQGFSDTSDRNYKRIRN